MPDSSRPTFEFDVFLSFRGEDTRKGFTGHLCEALRGKGISTFLDSEELHKGRRIDELLGTIECSEILIPVFSKRYADSEWCLREIAKIVECDRLVLPVFFDVEPRDVRHQTGPFEPAFLEHEKNTELNEETVNGWRGALRKAGELCGYELLSETNGRHEAKLIQVVVKDVLSQLKCAPMNIAEHPIGVDYKVEDVMRLLDIEANDVRLVGVHGMGGIGKTTIAKAIYNSLHRDFDHSCFIFNIAERSKADNSLVDLQKKLIVDLFKVDVSSISIDDALGQGINVIRQRVAHKKILLVLDDIDDERQLKSLAGKRSWFSPGSRVLITTRDDSLLVQHDLGRHEIYSIQLLKDKDSLQLFSYHAFRNEKPPEEHLQHSIEVVRAAGGLPLALEVYGSLCFDLQTVAEWEEMLENLTRAPNRNVLQKLRISYDRLTKEEKRIFLDIACFFVGKNRQSAMQMWESCKLFPHISVKVLVHKSLVKMNSNSGEFEVHDLIRDMGRDIVRQESPSNPLSRSRLWDPDDILYVLQNPKEMCSNIEAIVPNSRPCGRSLMSTDVFRKMPNLRLLQLSDVDLNGILSDLPKNLNWLELRTCNFRNSRCNSIFGVLKKWGPSRMVFGQLKILDLSDCTCLTSTPDFSRTPFLIRLKLDFCCNLKKVHASIRHLKSLKFWSMIHCTSLRELPTEASELSSLEILDLSYCTSFESLPERMGDMEALVVLVLEGTGVKKLPESVTMLKKLSKLSLERCSLLVKLPGLIGRLESLNDLSIVGTKIEGRDSILDLANLQELDARRTAEKLGGAYQVRLKFREPGGSNPPANLQKLRVPNLNWDGIFFSVFLSNFVFESMPSLEALILDGNNLDELPLCISQLSKLSRLQLLSICECPEIHYLPQLPSSLMHLHARGCTSLETLWDISNLKHLRTLDLKGCSSVSWIYGVQYLESIEEIDLSGCFHLGPEFDITYQKEEDLKWFYDIGCLCLDSHVCQRVSCSTGRMVIRWDRKLNSVGVLIYAVVNQQIVFESSRIAYYLHDPELMTDVHDPELMTDDYLYTISLQEGDELYKLIRDLDVSVHVRPGPQDLSSRCTERTTFKQLKQFHFPCNLFHVNGQEKFVIPKSKLVSFVIPKSPASDCQIYITEMVLNFTKFLGGCNPFHVLVRVMIEGRQVFETTKVLDSEDVGRTSSELLTAKFELLTAKFGKDEDIHKLLGREPAVLQVTAQDNTARSDFNPPFAELTITVECSSRL